MILPSPAILGFLLGRKKILICRSCRLELDGMTMYEAQNNSYNQNEQPKVFSMEVMYRSEGCQLIKYNQGVPKLYIGKCIYGHLKQTLMYFQ